MCRLLAVLVILALLGPPASGDVCAQAPASDPARPTGAIPLASPAGFRYPEHYPDLLLGLGVRTFGPDFAGLTRVYDRTPSFGLSPILCGLCELALAEFISLQADAGLSIAPGGASGYHALAGLAGRWPLSSALRPCLGAGVTFCAMRAEASDIITLAGSTGAYVTAGFDWLTGTDLVIDLFGGYCFFPEESTEFEGIAASIDFSGPIFGARLKWRR